MYIAIFLLDSQTMYLVYNRCARIMNNNGLYLEPLVLVVFFIFESLVIAIARATMLLSMMVCGGVHDNSSENQ